MKTTENDPLGDACLAWQRDGRRELDIIVHSDIAEDDVIPVEHLFRPFGEMPLVEQRALEACHGKVLDIGAGAGSHALWLQENGYDVTALDISAGAVATMRQRGTEKVVQADLAAYRESGFDTVLLLMNGIGLCGRREQLKVWLEHLHSFLAPGGQILLDSSDLKYMFVDDPEAMEGPDYYGHVTYQMEFEGALTKWFDWMYLAPQHLQEDATSFGWQCEILCRGPHHDFLAKLSRPI